MLFDQLSSIFGMSSHELTTSQSFSYLYFSFCPSLGEISVIYKLAYYSFVLSSYVEHTDLN